MELTRWEEVEIPTEYKGLVIGKHGANLLKQRNRSKSDPYEKRGAHYLGNKATKGSHEFAYQTQSGR